MSKKAIIFQCPVDYHENRISFPKAPSSLEPIRTKITCLKCRSRFLVTLKRRKDLGPNKIETDYILLEISEKAKLIIEEAEAARANAEG
jgi:hypothetical protein